MCTSNLTKAEILASNTRYDLAIGYPEIKNPEWLLEVWNKSSLDDLLKRFLDKHPNIKIGYSQSLPNARELSSVYIKTALKFLGLPSCLEGQADVAYSGSHGLERIFSTLITHETVVLITSPCIDIIAEMISEKKPKQVEYFPVALDNRGMDFVKNLCDAIESIKPNVLVLTSPDNPSGHVLSLKEMNSIAAVCIAMDTTLVIDHCFSCVSREDMRTRVVADLQLPELSWAMTWDTGKFLDLDDEKICIVLSSKNLAMKIRKRLEILQFSLPRRLLMMMSLLLDLCGEKKYLSSLSKLMKANLNELRQALSNTSVNVISGASGGFALLDLSDFQMSSSDFVRQIREEDYDVGVVDASSFFYAESDESMKGKFIRISLLRDVGYFSEAVSIIKRFVLNHKVECIK